MIYKIYKDGELVNRIVADEDFCRGNYSEDGYSYELEPEPPSEDEPTPEEQNARLRAQVAMLQEQQTFLEDCLLEMAEEVYA